MSSALHVENDAAEIKTISLMDALRKMTLLPAKRLEKASAQMKLKGRVQVGADADLTLFDAATIRDRSTFDHGDVPSAGIVHVFVSGVHVLADGSIRDGLCPGHAIRGSRQ